MNVFLRVRVLADCDQCSRRVVYRVGQRARRCCCCCCCWSLPWWNFGLLFTSRPPPIVQRFYIIPR